MGSAQRADDARKGARLSTESVARLWGGADYEALADRFSPVHDELVERLAPRPGERWLDVATGTGTVALRAAASGAEVTGVDIAPGMIELARAKAPEIRFEVGDCQGLTYPDGGFDVVSSSFGFIFAPDHAVTAAELARVCSGRLGFTAWKPNPELRDLYRAFDLDSPEGAEPFEWGKPEHVRNLLGDPFELEIESRVWVLEGESGDDVWRLWSSAAPPFKAMVDGLEPERRDAFRAGYVDYCERYRDAHRVRVPRPYLLVLGRRR